MTYLFATEQNVAAENAMMLMTDIYLRTKYELCSVLTCINIGKKLNINKKHSYEAQRASGRVKKHITRNDARWYDRHDALLVSVHKVFINEIFDSLYRRISTDKQIIKQGDNYIEEERKYIIILVVSRRHRIYFEAK